MVARIVRLGGDRVPDEGTRIGTVRRPPLGVPKAAFASQNWYACGFANLAPSLETIKIGRSVSDASDWRLFMRKYLAEMATPADGRTLDLLAALSRQGNFSVGCYLRGRVPLPSVAAACIADRARRGYRYVISRNLY